MAAGTLGTWQTAILSPPNGFPWVGEVVATATDSTAPGNTSEFSPSVQVPEPGRGAMLVAGIAGLALLHTRSHAARRRGRLAQL